MADPFPGTADGRVNPPVGEECSIGVLLQQLLGPHHGVPAAKLHVLGANSMENGFSCPLLDGVKNHEKEKFVQNPDSAR